MSRLFHCYVIIFKAGIPLAAVWKLKIFDFLSKCEEKVAKEGSAKEKPGEARYSLQLPFLQPFSQRESIPANALLDIWVYV
jgi:hypothetical protein